MAARAGNRAPAALVIVDLLSHIHLVPDTELFQTVRHALSAKLVDASQLFVFGNLSTLSRAARVAGAADKTSAKALVRGIVDAVRQQRPELETHDGKAIGPLLRCLTRIDHGWMPIAEMTSLLEHTMLTHRDNCFIDAVESLSELQAALARFICECVAPRVRGHKVVLMLRSHGMCTPVPNEHTWWSMDVVQGVTSKAEGQAQVMKALSPAWLVEHVALPLACSASAPLDPVRPLPFALPLHTGYLLWVQNTCYSQLVTRQLAAEFAARTGAPPMDVSAAVSGAPQGQWATLADAVATAELEGAARADAKSRGAAAGGGAPAYKARALAAYRGPPPCAIFVSEQAAHSELKSVFAALGSEGLGGTLAGKPIARLAAEADAALKTLAEREAIRRQATVDAARERTRGARGAAAEDEEDEAGKLELLAPRPRGLKDISSFLKPIRLAPIPVTEGAASTGGAAAAAAAAGQSGAGALPTSGATAPGAASSPRAPAEPDADALRDVVVAFVRQCVVMTGPVCELRPFATWLRNARRRDWIARARSDLAACPWPGEQSELPPPFEPPTSAGAAIAAASASWDKEFTAIMALPPRFAAAFAAAADAAAGAARRVMGEAIEEQEWGGFGAGSAAASAAACAVESAPAVDDPAAVDVRAGMVAGLIAARDSLRASAEAAAAQAVALLPASVLAALGVTPALVDSVVASARRKWEAMGQLCFRRADPDRELVVTFSHSAGLQALWQAVVEAAPPAAPGAQADRSPAPASAAPQVMTDAQAALYAAAAPRVFMTLPRGAALVSRAGAQDLHVARLTAARIRLADAAGRLAGKGAVLQAGADAGPAPSVASSGSAPGAPAAVPPLLHSHAFLSPWLPPLECSVAEESGRPRYAARVRVAANVAAELGLVLASAAPGALATLVQHAVALPEMRAEPAGKKGGKDRGAPAADRAWGAEEWSESDEDLGEEWDGEGAALGPAGRPELGRGADHGWFALGGIAASLYPLLFNELGDKMNAPLTRKVARTWDRDGSVPGFSLRTSTIAADPYFGRPKGPPAAAAGGGGGENKGAAPRSGTDSDAVGPRGGAPRESLDDEEEEDEFGNPRNPLSPLPEEDDVPGEPLPLSRTNSVGSNRSAGSSSLNRVATALAAVFASNARVSVGLEGFKGDESESDGEGYVSDGEGEAVTPGSSLLGGAWGAGALTLRGLDEHLNTASIRERVTWPVHQVQEVLLPRSETDSSTGGSGDAQGDSEKTYVVLTAKELVVETAWLQRLRTGPRRGIVLAFGMEPSDDL